MSDFLGRLAARQLGDIQVVSPRLPLRFGPVVEQPPDEPILPVPASSPERPAIAHIAPSEAPLVAQVMVATPAVPSGDAPRPDPPVELITRRGEEVPPRQAPTSVAPEAPTREPPRAVPPHPLEPPPPPAVPQEPPSTIVSPALAPIADPAEDGGTSRVAGAAPPQPLVAPRRQVVSLVAAPSLAEAASPQAPANASTVTVTIGRLEVRAVPAPPTAERKAPAPPAAMSLETYLERRRAPRR